MLLRNASQRDFYTNHDYPISDLNFILLLFLNEVKVTFLTVLFSLGNQAPLIIPIPSQERPPEPIIVPLPPKKQPPVIVPIQGKFSPK